MFRVVGRRFFPLLVAVAAAAPMAIALPLGRHPAGARITFDGTYKPPTLGAWSGVDVDGRQAKRSRTQAPPPGVAVVHAPGQVHAWAGRFSVAPAMSYASPSGPQERTEIFATARQTRAQDGDVTYYSWATYFPSGFRTPTQHSAIIDQVKRVGGRCGPPNLSVRVNTDARGSNPNLGMVRLIMKGGAIVDNTSMPGSSFDCPGLSIRTFELAPFIPDRWYYFLLRVAWSPNPRVGSVTAWLNGRLVVQPTHVASLYTDSNGGYWRQGLYENANPVPAHLYQLGVVAGTSARIVTGGDLLPARPRASMTRRPSATG